MNVKPGSPLRPWQIAHPVLWRSSVHVEPSIGQVDRWSSMLKEVFGEGRSRRLQTWARPADDPNGPHWIGVRGGTPLHTDPRYPRYTHQLLVRNDGWRLTGWSNDLSDPPWIAGTIFCCDTHSPHILTRDIALGSGLFYLAASIDSKTPLALDDVLPRLVAFVEAS